MKNDNSHPISGFQQQNLPQSLPNHYKSPLNHHQSLLNHYKSQPNHNQSLPNPHRSLIIPSLASLFLLAFPLLILFLSGCEKVIDVDLNESEPALVIEGNLSQNEGTLEVKISNTASYFSNQPMPKVEEASVMLTNGPGFQLQAEQTEPGLYRLDDLPVNFNSVYRLTVKMDGQEYTGVSTLNPLVKIDSIAYEYQQEQIFFEGGYRVLLYFTDPGEEENYYRVKLYKNGERFDEVDDLIIFDDSSLDGKSIQVRLRGQLFEPQDTVKVELLSIDYNAWEYFSSLREVANLNPGSPSPANPLSNLSNGALGYFSAWTSSTRELIIPE